MTDLYLVNIPNRCGCLFAFTHDTLDDLLVVFSRYRLIHRFFPCFLFYLRTAERRPLQKAEQIARMKAEGHKQDSSAFVSQFRRSVDKNVQRHKSLNGCCREGQKIYRFLIISYKSIYCARLNSTHLLSHQPSNASQDRHGASPYMAAKASHQKFTGLVTRLLAI